MARYFARGMVRPAMLVVLAFLIVPIVVLTIRHSLYASGGNTITVTSLLDPGTAGDGQCGLREAIANANAEADTTSGDCTAGTGSDTIVFSVSGTIALASGLPAIQHMVEIDGTGETIAIDGGGTNQIMQNSGSLTLNNLTISNGDTTGSGGGIFNSGTLAATNSTFLGNQAAAGGAIFNSASGALTVSNCTFSGNVSAAGGAIQTGNSATVTSSTFSNNSAGGVAGAGAAVLANNATLTVTNSIMANSTGLNCGVSNAGVIANGGDDISDDGSCALGTSTGANGDTIGDNVAPLLDTNGLQNNGGPTDTIALQATSPAVNAVPTGNCLTTDQRGDPRPSFLCSAENQGFTQFKAEFCIASNTNYSLNGSVQASANQDLGNITAVGVVSIATSGSTPVFIVNEQASNGQDVPISMSLSLTAGCYDMNVEVFSDALPSGTGGGSASASGNVLLSPK